MRDYLGRKATEAEEGQGGFATEVAGFVINGGCVRLLSVVIAIECYGMGEGSVDLDDGICRAS